MHIYQTTLSNLEPQLFRPTRCRLALSTSVASIRTSESPTVHFRRRTKLTTLRLESQPVRGFPCKASEQSDAKTEGQPAQNDPTNLISNIAMVSLWAALMYYVVVLAPNQTPLRDSYFVEKLVGLGENDGVSINAVFTQIWNLMGLWPAMYAFLLVPAGRSENKVPAWPFISASFLLGMYALIPYMALWTVPKQPEPLPPAKADLQGWKNVGLRIAESPITAGLLVLGTTALVYQAATAGPSSWAAYAKLFEESRLVHATSIDFCLFTAFAPFWMYNDAQRRDWGPRDIAVPILSLLPSVGPAIYLLLRPKAK